MKDQLFENVGKDIKTFAKTVSGVILFLHSLLGIVFVAVGCMIAAMDSGLGFFVFVGFLIAIAIVAWGYILSRLAVMLMYAYGEMTDRLISIDGKLTEKPKRPIPVKPTPGPRRSTPWQCQFCDHQNPPEARWCQSCGTEDINV